MAASIALTAVKAENQFYDFLASHPSINDDPFMLEHFSMDDLIWFSHNLEFTDRDPDNEDWSHAPNYEEFEGIWDDFEALDHETQDAIITELLRFIGDDSKLFYSRKMNPY